MSEPFIGEIKILPYTFAPKGWAYCNGQLLAISQNQALFSILGTTYGGNGINNFALPNLQGRVPLHAGTGPGLTPRSLGEASGSGAVSLTVSQIPFHTHTLSVGNVPGTQRNVNNAYPAQAGSLESYQENTTPLVPMNAAAVANTGGGQPHTNMQPYLGINYCIALVGIFPSRN